MSFLCRVSSDALNLELTDESVRKRIEDGEHFYTPEYAQVLGRLCKEWRKKWRGVRGPLRDVTNRYFMVWVDATDAKRAHVKHYKGEGPPGNAARGHDGAHEWVQECLYRLGQTLGATAAIEVPFGEGYRADVVWRFRHHALCLEVDLTNNSSTEQGARFDVRGKEGWRPVALMEASDPNQAHVELPRLLVNNLRDTAQKGARAEQLEFDLPSLYVFNISALDGEKWVPRYYVHLREMLAWLASSPTDYSYIQVEPPSGEHLKGQWAWVRSNDRDKLREHQAARQRAAEVASARQRADQAARQRTAEAASARQRAERREQRRAQIADKTNGLHVGANVCSWKRSRLEALDVVSPEACAAFLANVQELPQWWLSETEVAFIKVVERLASWRRLFDWGGRLSRSAVTMRQQALDDLAADAVDMKAKLAEAGDELEALATEEANEPARTLETDRFSRMSQPI